MSEHTISLSDDGIVLGDKALTINANLAEKTFLASSYAQDARRDFVNPRDDYCWYTFNIDMQAQACWFSLCFHAGFLYSATLDCSTTPFSWDDWSLETVMQIKAENSAFLHDVLGLVEEEDYMWGSARSVYDEKGGFSKITIKLKPHMT